MFVLPALAVLSILSPCLAAPSDDAKFTADFKYDKFETNYKKLPKRSELPTIPGHLKGSAWLWGEDDGLGRLNFLTPQRVFQSMKEVKTGELVPLNLPVKLVDPPFFTRKKFNHSVFPTGGPPVMDEEYHMNTQTSTQWDGFHHFAHLPTGIFYNGCTMDNIPNANLTNNHKCGIQEWAQHGIAGRAILLDFASYAERKKIKPDVFAATNITFSQLKAVAKDQGLDLRTKDKGGDIRIGDILLLRTGFTKAYKALTIAERQALADRHFSDGPDTEHRFIGVAQTEEMADWIHNSYFSAVAGDTPAFESWPPQGPLSLHEQILTYWGVALGEFFDLDTLAEKCAKRKKWTFFVTSAPFNVYRGIASWANAIAIL
ncbi:hypothetical protein K440DRAFT_685493 [Wilcoxina mikolae CBS 423.85]|nr:hypothetical protein K440DRAFT_685493 [Wilcoxina mikolae CBS 423.85]